MSAFINLLTFASRLDGELLADFQQRVNAYMDEKYNLQSERIATLQATTGNYEVVAIAGTAEHLLTDVTDTNVGEINVGDTVECIRACYPTNHSGLRIIKNGKRLVVDIVFNSTLVFSGYDNYYPAKNFRKVSTPIVNPIQTASDTEDTFIFYPQLNVKIC